MDWIKTQLDTFRQELRDAKKVSYWGVAVEIMVERWERTESWEEDSKEEYDGVVTRSREEASCMMEAWRCFSEALEEGVRHLDRPEAVQGWGRNITNSFSVFRLVKKVMYKIAFHGSTLSSWSSVMALPEVDNRPPYPSCQPPGEERGGVHVEPRPLCTGGDTQEQR